MPTEEDLDKDKDESAEEAEASDAAESTDETSDDAGEVRAASDSSPDDAKSDADAEGQAPVQLGYLRYVYAAYMAGAMLVAFLAAKLGHVGWYRLGQWKPELGEPQDEIVYSVAAVLGILVALYYWRKAEARQYANEVAEELSKVTWPSRKEVTNSTTVVVLTTLFATLFFALMDRFWGYVTDHIYSF